MSPENYQNSSMNLVNFQDIKLINRNLFHFYILKVSEREIKETIPFTITSRRIKYLGINLPKKVKDLYQEIYKALLKSIKDGMKKWKRYTVFLD